MSRIMPHFLIRVVEALLVKAFFHNYFQKILTSIQGENIMSCFPPIDDNYWRMHLRESDIYLWIPLVLIFGIFIKKIVNFIL